MIHDNEASVRQAYHAAEGNVLDVAGFVNLFTADGVFNLGHGGFGAGGESFRGEHLGDLLVRGKSYFPDIHRELHRVNVSGDLVTAELLIQATFSGPMETPAGVIQPTGAKINVPCADLWYMRDGKIAMFNCYLMLDVMRAQMAAKG